MLNQTAILQVENIATRFRTQEGQVHAVNGISFELKKKSSRTHLMGWHPGDFKLELELVKKHFNNFFL